MRAGLLTDIINIYRTTTVLNDYGELVQEYALNVTTRARIIHNSGNRLTENNALVYIYNKTFEVYYYVDVIETDYIEWDSKKYRILAIEPVKDLNKKVITTELITE